MPVPMPIPADAIFVAEGETLYHVVNWRGRRHAGGRATLVRLSPRHAELYRSMKARGRPDACIPDLLFLPMVAPAVLAGIPAEPLPLAPLEPLGPPVAASPRAAPVAAQPSPASSPLPAARVPRRHRFALPDWVRGSRVSWAVSGFLHAGVLIACCGIVWVLHPPDAPVPPVRMRAQVTSERPPAPARELPPDLTPALATTAPAPPTLSVEELAEGPTLDPEDTPARVSTDLGTAVAISDVSVRLPLLGTGSGQALGMGPRGNFRRRALLSANGGSAASQNAVDAALRWFHRHQEATGEWDPVTYRYRCNEVPKCEPGPMAGGRALEETYRDAMTGLALLCYLGAGYDPATPSQYQHTVQAAVHYLVTHQAVSGYFGTSNYSHAIVTMALCEALAVAPDARLKNACLRAVRALLAHQNRDAGPGGVEVGYGQRSGWDYVGPSLRDDTSVTGWNIMALHSARGAGLDVGHGLDGATAWLDRTWQAANPDWQQLDAQGETRFPYCVVRLPTPVVQIGPPTGQMLDLAGVGAMAAAFLPHDLSDTELQSLTRYIERVQTPAGWYNRYYLYYDTLALFQVGGEPWKRWNRVVMPMLVRTQNRTGCFAGSWDDGPGGFCRLFSSALCCLTLEVYYRYERVRPSS